MTAAKAKAAAAKASEQEMLSVAQIAERFNINQKSVRAHLRSKHARSLELKNNRWGDASKNYALSAELTAALVKHYSRDAESETA